MQDYGTTLSAKSPTPVHAADIIRMVAVYNRLHVRCNKATSEISLISPPDKFSDQSPALPVLPHPLSRLVSLKVNMRPTKCFTPLLTSPVPLDAPDTTLLTIKTHIYTKRHNISELGNMS